MMTKDEKKTLRRGLLIAAVLLSILVSSGMACAVTKPVRGFVDYGSGVSAEGVGVSISVKVHSGMDEQYWCYCHVDDVTTNYAGEFVQDLGNLRYSGDCPFWSKSEGDDCSNDWTGSDLIGAYISAKSGYSSGYTAAESISPAPIHELGTIVLDSDEGPSVPSAPAAGSVSPVEPTPLSMTDPLMPSPLYPVVVVGSEDVPPAKISSLRLEYSERIEQFLFVVQVESRVNETLESLRLEIEVKDVLGQPVDLFSSDVFQLRPLEARQVRIPYVDDIEGVSMISSRLYHDGELVAVSPDVEVIVYEKGKGLPLIVMKSEEIPQSSWLLWAFVSAIALILIVLVIEILIMVRSGHSGRDRKQEGSGSDEERAVVRKR